ncbi:MAG TPA: glycoside hydrolase family 88 protein [bacterium]|nr:glycoside hydrolase family 88 protein [bacterium]HPR86750.1 glycoside hydrolase family 88 protein [bacterium]
MKTRFSRFGIAVLFLLCSSLAGCAKFATFFQDLLGHNETSPAQIGRLVAHDLLSRSEYYLYLAPFWRGIHYSEACAGFGAAHLAGLLHDKELLARLASRYARANTDSLTDLADHVDANVYGILPLELYRQTGEKTFFQQGIALADAQWVDPRPDGLTRQTRFWIDDIWMIGALQVQAWRTTGKPVYLERAALEIDVYLQKLQQPNGLFYHGEGAPFFWGRGNGWAAAGMAELLSELPPDNPHYPAILAGYRRMMDALRRYQAEDGMWRQLIDTPSAWKESSATAMFGYAVTVGVNKGLLDPSLYKPVYEKAWEALLTYIGADGRVAEVCIGTGKSADITHYLTRPRVTGDLHGQAPVLWFACALLERNR